MVVRYARFWWLWHMGHGRCTKIPTEKPHLLNSIALNIFKRMNNNNDTITKDALNRFNVRVVNTRCANYERFRSHSHPLLSSFVGFCDAIANRLHKSILCLPLAYYEHWRAPFAVSAQFSLTHSHTHTYTYIYSTNYLRNEWDSLQ